MEVFTQRCQAAARAAPILLIPEQEINRNARKSVRTTPREELIMFAIGGRTMYALSIQRAIAECSQGDESISLGAIYPVLGELERKGLIEAQWGEEEIPVRGGARRRYYRLSNAGKAVVHRVLELQQKLLEWKEPEES